MGAWDLAWDREWVQVQHRIQGGQIPVALDRADRPQVKNPQVETIQMTEVGQTLQTEEETLPPEVMAEMTEMAEVKALQDLLLGLPPEEIVNLAMEVAAVEVETTDPRAAVKTLLTQIQAIQEARIQEMRRMFQDPTAGMATQEAPNTTTPTPTR